MLDLVGICLLFAVVCLWCGTVEFRVWCIFGDGKKYVVLIGECYGLPSVFLCCELWVVFGRDVLWFCVVGEFLVLLDGLFLGYFGAKIAK